MSYLCRADNSTIFRMRGLWGLTINSGRGATLKYLYDGWKENSRGDSDEYHRFLQFFILDLHKSEVGPLRIDNGGFGPL